MLDTIITALKNENIDIWRITRSNVESCELFFIKKKLDSRRIKKVCKYCVTVWHDFERDGIRFRGSGTAVLHPGMSLMEIESYLKSAYTAAGFVCNPFYELPKPEAFDGPETEFDCEKASLTMVEALFKADHHEKGFINSAEFFSSNQRISILSSTGTNVSFTNTLVNGEFVVQCKEPQDVEQYRSFAYLRPNPDALTEKANSAIIAVEDRANAVKSAPAGIYDVVLTGDHLRTILDYYLERANAANIYSQYSDFKVGESVQGENISGALLNIRLLHDAPFSSEGIRLTERDLIKDGKLCCIPGSTRFARYINAEPIGSYNKLGVENGDIPYSEMIKNSLVPISFSDFQMDSFSGHFGGEIRLAYLYDADGNRTLVTGGSINGDIFSAQADMAFSIERYSSNTYEGPFALRVKGVSVAG